MVQNNFPIACDGIIGMNFIKNYNCVLDFNEENYHLTLRPSNLSRTIEISITNNYNEITLRPRSEVIRQIKSLNHNIDILIPIHQVEPGALYQTS